MRISDWSSDVCSSDLLEFLADLARDRRVAVTEAFTQCRERRGEAGATFVEDERGAHRSDLGNRGGAGAGLGGEETEEEEPVGGKTRQGEGGDRRAGTGDRMDADARRARVADQLVAGIGDERRPGIRYKQIGRAHV